MRTQPFCDGKFSTQLAQGVIEIHVLVGAGFQSNAGGSPVGKRGAIAFLNQGNIEKTFRGQIEIDSADPYPEHDLPIGPHVKGQRRRVDLAEYFLRTGDDLLLDSFQSFTEEKNSKNDDDSAGEEPSCGSAVLGLAVVSDEGAVAEEVRFSESVVDAVPARWH